MSKDPKQPWNHEEENSDCPVDHLTLYYAWRLVEDEMYNAGLETYIKPPPCPRCKKELTDE